MQRINPKLKANSRALRRNLTDTEQHLWRYLRMRQMHGLKFRRQYPCGSFILDFACIEVKLAIEIDGGQHNARSHQDAQRTLWLASQGWQVLRFWNHEILGEIEAVLEVIHQTLAHHSKVDPHPNLPPNRDFCITPFALSLSKCERCNVLIHSTSCFDKLNTNGEVVGYAKDSNMGKGTMA